MAIVAVILLIACSNIAQVMLARVSARRHELNLRRALGASPWRLVRQLLTESLLLALVGGAVAVAIASWGSSLLIEQFSAQSNGLALDLTIDANILAFAIGITVGTALLFGLAPALLAHRTDVRDGLRGHRRAGGGRGGHAHTVLVVQIALSVVLMVVKVMLSRVLASIALGLVIGGAVCAWVSPTAEALLYGVEPRDPATLIGAMVVLATVAVFAGWLPGWRAARLDPAVVLRDS
jgi:ABC-type antimicrobial peptide transport system permease subunit